MDYKAYQQALRERVGVLELAFSAPEYAQRRQRLAQRMADEGLDLLLVTDVADIFYLTGYVTFEVSVHICLVVSADRLILQVPSIETGPAVAGSAVDEVVGYRWEGQTGAAGQLAEIIHSLAPSARPAIGTDNWSASLRVGVHNDLRSTLTQAQWRDASGLVDALKIVKSQAELALLRESARVTGIGLDAATAAVEAGVTDSEIAAAGAEAMLAAGSEFMSMQPIVTAGRRSSVIHTNHRRHRIQPNEPVFLEFGAAWQRYTAPMMRTVVAGRPDGRMQRVFDTCQAIYETLCTHMRAGAPMEAAAQAAEATLSPVADEVFHSGVYGYAVGAQFPPSWVEGSGYIARSEERPFEENMVFHLPLCLRVPGQWGIGVSETVRIGPNGAEAITANRWELIANPVKA